MNAYKEAVKKFRTQFLIEAVIEDGGYATRTARRFGIHLNTVSSALSSAGLTQEKLRAIAREKRVAAMLDKKPVRSVATAGELRRMA